MSFNFPKNPTDLDTTVNEQTGAIYQWRGATGKWVLTQEATLADELIWEGVTEPPAGEGYKLWYNTNDKVIYFEACDDAGNCVWTHTSPTLETYVKIDGDTMTGTLSIEKPISDTETNTNSFTISGRTKNSDGTLNPNGVLLKDHRRISTDPNPDYITYHGTGGGVNAIMTEASSDARFVKLSTDQTVAGKKTFSGETTFTNTAGAAVNLKGKIAINGTTTADKYLGTDGSGNLKWKVAVATQTQSDWNTNSSQYVSFIKNKPTVVEGSKSGIRIVSSNGNYYIEG